MSKATADNKAEAMEADEHEIPGRALGLSIMCAMIVFVAFWMSLQSGQTYLTVNTTSTFDADATAGFLADSWYLPDDELLGFVLIPTGSFLMGSNPALDRLAYENERWSSSRRQGTVDLPEYYIGKFEVTVAQFSAFIEDSPDQANSVFSSAVANIPITNITWPEALAYARWLEQQMKASANTPEDLKSFLESGGRIILPSEAEWEKAARGTDGRVFPWGNETRSDLANYGSTAVLPVGSKPCTECAHGLADMSGNVWEITRSPMQAYPYDSEDDAENLSDDALWVMRGGSYSDTVGNVRAAVRGAVDPGVRNGSIGFRLVISKL